MIRRALLVGSLVGVLVGTLACGAAKPGARPGDLPTDPPAAGAGGPAVLQDPVGLQDDRQTVSGPLAGIRVGLDPGHQLGNRNFSTRISRLVPAGGFRKPCNTTGTATRSGYPEATVTFAVASRVRYRLERLGASVVMTRQVNSDRRWGPCVDRRGTFGQRTGADLVVSIHADGATGPAARGFHVVAPVSRRPWTHDIAAESLLLARALRSGLDADFSRAGYVAGGDGLDRRSDLATLNLADVPVALVELGNMRDRRDALVLVSAAGQGRYAEALVAGIRRYLDGRKDLGP